MTTFPNSPRLLKGAIVGLDPVNPLASVIIFQYNPDTLTITASAVGNEADRGEDPRLRGPPEETIRLEINATDQLERVRLLAKQGVPPSLARDSAITRLDGGAWEVAPGSKAEVVGARVAQNEGLGK